MQDVSGLDEFAFAVKGEWFRQDGVTVMVVQYHDVLATSGRGDRKTSDLVSAYFSIKLNFLYIRHLGSDTRFLQRKGKGRYNRRIGDVSGGRLVLVDHTFCRSLCR